MYASINSKEPWHREGDVFVKISQSKFDYGHVKLHENPDTLAIYWPQHKNFGMENLVMNDEFHDVDFKNVFLLDQRFSLGEVIHNEKRKLLGEVVGIKLNAVAHVYDSDHVIAGIPLELLKPEVTLEKGKVLLNGWIGEVKDKFWTVAVEDGGGIKAFRDLVIPSRILPSCAFSKTIIPVPGYKMQVGMRNKKYKIIDRKLGAARIEWYHRLKWYPYTFSEEPPPKLIKNPQMLKSIIEIDPNHFKECKKHVLCNYTIRETDQWIPLKNWERVVFDDMLGLNCNYSNCDCDIVKKKRRIDNELPFRAGDTVLVNVLRTFSLLDVEWKRSNDRIIKETVRSKDMPHQNRFKYPKIGIFRQFVSVKEQYSTDLQAIGVTMCRNHQDKTVLVQWLKKPGEKLLLAEESEFDLIPHESFGMLHIGQLVERNNSCHLADFIVGVIQDIMSNGCVKIEMGSTEKKEIILTPDEILICPSINEVGAAKMKFDLKQKELNQSRNDKPQEDITINSSIKDNQRETLPNEYYKAIARDKALMQKYQGQPHLGIIFQPVDYRDFCTAIIYGPEGTPYEDGLFMFEIHFPYSYPNAPPVIKMVTKFKNSVSFHFGKDGQIVRKIDDVLFCFPSPILWKADVTLEDLLLTIKNFIFLEEPFIHTYPDWDNGMTSFDVERIKFHKGDCLQRYNSQILLEIFDSLLYLRSLESCLEPVWRETIVSHLETAIPKIKNRLKSWLLGPNRISENKLPKFALFPLSKGLKASIKLRLQDKENVTSD